MIETLAVVAEALATEALEAAATEAAQEGIAGLDYLPYADTYSSPIEVLDAEDVGGGDALGGLDADGQYDAFLDACGLSSEALEGATEVGREGLGVEGLSSPEVGVEERVPLEDSKGEVRHLLSPEESEHYEEVGLRPQEVDGRECLVRDDIDWERRDAYGQTNKARAEQGLAPLDREGRPYELHHVEQKADGMLAELTRDEHRGAGIDRVLHDPSKTSEIDRAAFDKIRAAHWRARAAEVQA